MQYSKVLPIVTGIIFLACLGLPIYFRDIDTSIFISAIGISGGIFGSSIIFYLKKAQVENTYKIKISLYEKAAEVRLKYNKEMASINNMQDDMQDIMEDALSDAKQTVDSAMDEAASPIELNNY